MGVAVQGDVTRWLYDEASNCMTNKVYADGNGTKYDYDANGRLTKRTWVRGVETTYTYNDWGSLTRTDYSDGTPSVVLTYDAMGRQTQAIDAAGTTTFAYDAFGSLTNETVVGVAGTNTIERFYDSLGRDVGYALNGVRRMTLGYDPATGRLATMLAAGSETPFVWNYLAGSDLKSSLLYPNGLTASWTYGNRGELLEVDNARPVSSSPSMTSNGVEVVSKYVYTYDAAGRRIGCDKSGSAFTTPDAYAYLYNARSELTNATAAVDAAYNYGYDFDDIGNRLSSLDFGTNRTYTANALNQYTQISNLCDSASLREEFLPQFDDDGNQTLIQTATGTWSVTYNGENRPVLWQCVSTNSSTHNSSTHTLLSMSYDRMGRRVTKNDQRFVYDGYLQIANFERASTNSQLTTYNSQLFIWDPTEKIATRPLVWNSSTLQPFNFSTSYYVHDGNKNVSDVVADNGDITAHYEYAPFGALTVSRGASAAANPFRFSSEYAEDDTATVYYNYRHYEPVMGRWTQRDPVGEHSIPLLYGYSNRMNMDYLGMEELDLSYFADYRGFPALFGILFWLHPDFAMFVDMKNAIGELGRFESAVDLQEQIFGRVKECDCIRLLRITAHGAAGDYDDARSDSREVQIQLGTGAGSIFSEGYNLEFGVDNSAISEYFGGFAGKFCKKCTIRLMACHLGENKHLADRIKKKTGCDVDVYKGYIFPWFPPDAPKRNPPPPMWAPSITGGFYYAY